MSVKIKICGLSTPETVEAAISAGADYAGFNFYRPSPRFLDAETAAYLARLVDRKITKVGVFVDPTDTLLADSIAAGSLDIVQLHKVTAKRRAEVKARFGLAVWAVIPVKQPADLACRNHIDSSTADLVLYDAATPVNSLLPGGMGLSFDWSMMQGLGHPYPWGLAGGLTPANVAEAIRVTGAPLVDTSSGVESAPGVKDVDLIRAFCEAARRP